MTKKGKPPILFINPHAWGEGDRKKIKERPMLDLRPEGFRPYSFKVKKESDLIYYAYNNILNFEFRCFFDKPEIYFIIDRGKFSSFDEISICTFIQLFLTRYLRTFKDYKIPLDNKNKKIHIEIITRDILLTNKNFKNLPKDKEPFLILEGNVNNYLIIIDPISFIKFFNSYPVNILKCFIDAIIQKLVSKKHFKIVTNKLLEIEPLKSNKITMINSVSDTYDSYLFYPTKLDYFDVEIDLHERFNSLRSGVYRDKKAEDVIKKVYNYLLKKLQKQICCYDLNDFIKFSYSEIERSFKARKKAVYNFILQQNLQLDYDSREIIQEELNKLNNYSPSCRYLLEQAIFLDINGKKNITIEDWKALIPIAEKILNFAFISDFLHYLSDYIDIKLEVKTENGFIVTPIIEENPLDRHMERYIDGLKNFDMSQIINPIDKIKGEKIESMQKNPDASTIKSAIKGFNAVAETGNFKKFNNELQKIFGFRLLHFSFVINIMTHLPPDKYSIVNIEHSELIDFINKKTGFEKDIISNVLDFLILFNDELERKPIEPWKVNTRKDRITAKPLVKNGNNIIFAPEVIIFVEENVRRHFIEGKWHYNQDEIPKSLEKRLNILQKDSSHEFEKEIFNVLKKYCDFCEINLCSKDKNDKCLINIKEKCPGEIDLISIHNKDKQIIVWEAKHIEQSFGSREISYDLIEFTDSKKGYLIKIREKEEFIRRSIRPILDYYNINDKDGWKVNYCIVVSSDIIVKTILEKKYNIINFYDLEQFIKNII